MKDAQHYMQFQQIAGKNIVSILLSGSVSLLYG